MPTETLDLTPAEEEREAWLTRAKRRAEGQGALTGVQREPPPPPAPLPEEEPPEPGLTPLPSAFWPYGRTEFSWILENLIGGGGGGDAGGPAITDETNEFTATQIINLINGDTNVGALRLFQDDNNPAITSILTIGHTYNGGVGQVGTGVGIKAMGETTTEGQTKNQGGVQWRWTDPTHATPDSEAQMVVVANDVTAIPMTWRPDTTVSLLDPAASATKALLMLGPTGALVGSSAGGTMYGANSSGAFTGDFLRFQKNGVDVFRVENDGSTFIGGTEITVGGGGDAFIGISNAWSAAQPFTLNDAAPTAVSFPVTLRHTHSGGNGQNGIGAGLKFEVEKDNGAVGEAGYITVDAYDAASATFSSQMKFRVYGGGAAIDRVAITPLGLFVEGDATALTGFGIVNIGNGAFGGGAGQFIGDAQGTCLAINMEPGFGGSFIDCQVDGSVRFLVDGAGNSVMKAWDTATTGPAITLALGHRLTSGTAAVGFGTRLRFDGQDGAGTELAFGQITADGRTLTAGAVNADMHFDVRMAGTLSERLRIRASTGHVEVISRLEAQGGLAVGNQVDVTAVTGEPSRRIEVFDAFTQASLGSLAVYANGSFTDA